MEKGIKERRLTELRAFEEQEEMIVEGYAVVFNSMTNLGWFNEVIDKNALSNCDMQDVCMKYNHLDTYPIMARTRNNSLELIVDDKGLKIRAKLANTQANRDIYTLIQEGTLDKMSYAFTVAKEEWDYETDTRKVLEIDKLYDVAVVDVPAYDSTEIYARSKEDLEKEKEKYEEDKLNLKKEKLKLMLSL